MINKQSKHELNSSSENNIFCFQIVSLRLNDLQIVVAFH